ncbi:hypothetical protein [Rhodococcus ruber]|uniref:hypothetical protein n=1 Tax=Rhodococcus ruber TaxID=1830 RepID=UPI000347FE5E|nr:hypothetical protein [Rhodococcus ruber]
MVRTDCPHQQDRAHDEEHQGETVPGEVVRQQLDNRAVDYGQGAVLGVVRSVMSEVGLRGPWASAKFTVLRLTNDQILENATGVGAPPQTWPRSELVVDVLHKAVYAFVTGVVADALAARRGRGPGQLHAATLPGRHAGVGPVPRDLASGRSPR